MSRAQHPPLLDRAIAWSLDHPLPAPARYVAATLLVLFVAAVRVTLVTALLPWLLFIPTILAIGLMLGGRPALYATLLSTVIAGYTIGSTSEPLYLTGPQWAGSILFLLVSMALARLVAELRASFQRVLRLNAELAEHGALVTSVLASSTDCIQVLDLLGDVSFVNAVGLAAFELDDPARIVGRPWASLFDAKGAESARSAVARAAAGEASHFTAHALTFVEERRRWWDTSVSPVIGHDGKPHRILAVSRDLTDLLDAQEQQRLLNGELGHRLKNVLALTQSIANQTFRQAQDLPSANAAFAARLAALGKATDVLTSTAWQSATLTDVVAAGLTSIAGMEDRVRLSGPPVKLDSQVALALTLALHELATNAQKYGALSTEHGEVALAWQFEPGKKGEDGRFRLQWREMGGPAVSPPTHKGFGTRMIERSLRGYFRGEMLLAYAPDGVVFSIDAPLKEARMGLDG